MSIFDPYNCLKQCRHGQLLFNSRDVFIGRSLHHYGEYSEKEVAVFRQLIQPGDLVLEVGANIGAHTVALAQLVRESGKVMAFEPQRLTFQTLCANLAINSIPNVYCFHAAAGKAIGHIAVPLLDWSKEQNFGGLTLNNSARGEVVSVLTIDSLDLTKCKLIKIDAEGMEQDIIEGAVRTIQRLRPVLYVENDRPDRSNSLIRFIDGLGYKMFWHQPPLFNPDNFAGNPENIFGNIVSLNMLCLPKSAPHEVSGFRPVEVPTGLEMS